MSQRRSRKSGNKSINLSQSQAGPSQMTLSQCFSQPPTSQISNDVVNKCVHYFLSKAGTNSVIRKTDLQKTVLQGHNYKFDSLINSVKANLQDVYGMTIATDQSTSNKSYFVVDNLPFKEELFVEDIEYADSDSDDEERTTPKDIHKVLKLLILSHVFMSGKSVNEESLYTYLSNLDINIDTRHREFGMVKDYIHEMVKQKYLNCTKDDKTNVYSWGGRSEAEISQAKILEFVCEIYGNCQPDMWTDQFKESQSQEVVGGE